MSIAKAKVPVFDTRLVESRDYWVRKLAGESGATNLRTDFERPAVYSDERKTFELSVPADFGRKLSKLTGGSPFLSYTLLLAALKICLHKYTGAETVVVGSPARRRDEDSTHAVNALPIADRVGRQMKFKELLMSVRETLVEAYAHQDYPFARLVRDVGLGEVENRCPLFDVALSFEGIHGEMPDVRNDITLAFRQTPEGIVGRVTYHAGLYAEATLRRLTGHLLNLSGAALDNLDARVGELSMLSEAERRLVLHEWNETPAARPAQPCLHQLFTRQARRTPDAVALVFQDQRFTYRQLDERTNRLANYLLRRGLEAGARVGIMVERSAEMIVGLLAVLKAGGVYVPLDPGYPAERVKYMLDDAAPQLVLTEERTQPGLEGYAVETISFHDDAGDIERESNDDPEREVRAGDAAYVIYTSGSTGQPKGVVVGHEGVSNLAYAQAVSFGVGEESRVLQFASFSFDTSVSDIFTAFAGGAALCVANREQRMSVPALATMLREQAVTLVTLPPAILALLDREGLPDLRTVVAAGEACPANVLTRWMEGRRFFNAYGPTEASVCATFLECREAYPEGPPIGRPWPNMQAYVLDEELQPAAVGITGELYIGGIGLAHGYSNQPELTAQRFIPHPFSSAPGARLYRSGDLARFRPDGLIEFLGRRDQQVKIRGFRIELGEVEAVLAGHPQVREVAVLLREDRPTEKQLVAYLVSDGGGIETTNDGLRGYVKQWLPEYMVPGRFVWLAEMPLTANGKIDRRSLPRPEDVRVSAGVSAGGEALTTVEEMVAGIWSEVLRVERVGVRDNFFELGGHSLLGTQLVSRIRETFDVEIALGSLFESPTVAQLAQLIEAELSEGRGFGLPPISRAGRDGELPLSFAQQRLWFLAQLEPDSSAYNISSALRLSGRLDVALLERTLGEVVRRHEVLRTTFAKTAEGRPVQIVAPAQPFALTSTDLAHLPEAQREGEARRRAMEEAHRPFDLQRGPLVRAHMLRLGETEQVLLFTMHHVISDGWSMGVLVREVAALYAAFAKGQPTPLDELEIQYADYAVWQREWLRGEALEAQLAYWREQLGGAPGQLELPVDHVRPAVHTHRGARRIQELSPALTAELEALSRREGVTLFMVLLAAFQVLLARYSGQTDIVVGAPVANRRRAELEELIGFFVNTLVLRTDLAGDPSFRELLQRVRKVALGAYAHQDVPFEKLVEELQPARDLSRSPLFQVMLALQNAPAKELELPELALSGIGVTQQTAKFELTLAIDRSGEQLVASLEYNTDLFEATTAERMLTHFVLLLESVVAKPEQRLSALPLMTEAERRRVLVEWNETRAEYSRQPVHELFSAQARRTPAALAVLYDGHQQLTYEELDRRSDRFARRLLRSGLTPEARVAVMVERGPEAVVALLGIFKAGGAYLPLDPAYPADRLSWMLEDARPHIVLTQHSLLARVPWTDVRIVSLEDWEQEEDDAAADAELAPAGRAAGVGAGGVAYVIYTSGSTGRPKGVMVEHAGLSNLAAAQARAFAPSEGGRVLQFASHSFDASIFEVVMALTNGATLCLEKQESLLPGPDFVKLLRERGITLATLPPSVLAASPDADLPELTTITVAGEACPADVAARWAGGRRFFNLYGPTEATIWTTAAPCDEATRKPPIGRPILNTQVYLLDERLEPAPVGVAGELHIGGVSLARGYLNRPDLTAERFIPDPFGGEPGARLYKSGDLARHLADGQLEFVGRVDEQVKIRGFRIEPGEVEAALTEHDEVREAVVVAREDVPGDKRLVAYIVTQREQPTIAELRQHLQERLPGYMSPASFVFLDAIPISPNGKIDRRALPAPGGYQPELETTYVAPQGEIELSIAAIWRETLNIEKVGVHDNFFSLGGHSVLLAQVHTKLRQSFTQELSIVDLFKYPTIDALAKHLSQQPHDDDTPPTSEGHERAETRLDLLKRQAQARQARGGGGATQGAQDE